MTEAQPQKEPGFAPRSAPAMRVGARDGAILRPGYLDRPGQEALLAAVRAIIRDAPLFTPRMPRTGKAFSVRMTNCGPLGWVSDERGYRYQPTHPETGAAWPPLPAILREVWADLASYRLEAQACLINYYTPSARMSLHQDRDEEDVGAPVVSLSLGDTGLFRVGGLERTAPTQSVRLSSGDAFVLGGDARMAFHGIDRIMPGTSTLLAEGGRFNLTMRRVKRAYIQARFFPKPASPFSGSGFKSAAFR